MIALSLAQIAEITGGTLHDLGAAHDLDAADATALEPRATGTTPITGAVEFDSRKIAPGDLFVALPGERVDGHDYAVAAVRSGAVAALAARPVGVPAVVVADVLAALGALARAVVDRLPDLQIIGITGSSGKTSTKDLLAQLLEPLGPTVAPPGSFNNELGHPYTVLRCDERTRFLVLEKSARGLGHVRWLTQIAPPRIGVVLNVGAAHVGEFGSLEITAKAKGELVEALPPGGVAVLNADDVAVAAMAGRTDARVVRYGVGALARSAATTTSRKLPYDNFGEVVENATVTPDVWATNVVLDDLGRASFTLHTPGGHADVSLALHGEHHVSNALACAAVVTEFGAEPAQIAAALGTARPRSPGRMHVTRRADGVTVIDDSYNANPDSMRAGLRALAAVIGTGRRWAVLGYMAELGDTERAEHAALGYTVAQLGIDELLVVAGSAGRATGELHAAASSRAGTWQGSSQLIPDVETALSTLRERLAPGDVVLVKASRAAGLDRVARGLLSDSDALDSDQRDSNPTSIGNPTTVSKEGTA